MTAWLDMHQHMGFAQDARVLAESLAESNVTSMCATVTPEEYLDLAGRMQGVLGLNLGLGLHPWWIADGRACVDELDHACECIDAMVNEDRPRILSEVGLDFSHKWMSFPDSKKRQLQAFTTLLAQTRKASQNPWVYSIHCVQADDVLLDCMEEHKALIPGRNDAVILHSFSGSCDYLQRAIALGCYFSVGERMLRTKRGKEYIKAIPRERLMLETDLPTCAQTYITSCDIVQVLERTLRSIEEIRGEALGQVMLDTSNQVLSLARA